MIESHFSLSDTRRLYDQAAVLAGFGAWECEVRTERLTWTDGVYDLFGFARGSTIRRADTVELYTDPSRREMERLRAALIATGTGFSLDARIHTVSGEERWMRLSASFTVEQGRPARIFGAKQDITGEKRLWTTLRDLAFRDALTGLSNRRAFEEELDRLVRPGSHDDKIALAILDLDHFKQINDRYGHAAGDICLQEAALRLTQSLPHATLIARLGGDEFAVLLRAPTSGHVVADLRRAVDRLASPVPCNGTMVKCSATIGATFCPAAGLPDPQLLFAEADAALYLAKAMGRSRLHVFGQPFEPKPEPMRTARAS